MTELMTHPQTREQWLELAVLQIADRVFRPHDIEVPKVRVSIGWPSRGGTGTTKRVIGQCWKGMAADDGVHQIFISPMLEDYSEILGVLVHELIHAIDDCESGHRGAFAKMARLVGLEGKLTATHPGDELREILAEIDMAIGQFDHSPLRPSPDAKKQTTRQLKIECPSCGCIARMTAKWLDDVGAPTCGCGSQMEQE